MPMDAEEMERVHNAVNGLEQHMGELSIDGIVVALMISLGGALAAHSVAGGRPTNWDDVTAAVRVAEGNMRRKLEAMGLPIAFAKKGVQ